MDDSFDEQAWRQRCEEISTEAARRSSCAYEYFVQLVSAAVDAALASLCAEHRERAVAIAREFDYLTPAELAASGEALDGYCQHGIELGCCPAGCGSF